MRKYLILLILLTSFTLVSSQENYDFIVISNGDSLACNVDSITDSHVYFEMKFNNIWIHTSKNINEVVEIKQKVLDKKTTYFKQGTSYLLPYQLPSRPVNNLNVGLFCDFSFISVQYERLFFIKPTFFITGKLGIGFNTEFQLFETERAPIKYTTFSYQVTGNLNLSKEKYFLFFGFGGTIISGDVNQKYLIYPVLGFRIQPLYKNKINFSPYIYIPLSSTSDLSSHFMVVPIGVSVGISF